VAYPSVTFTEMLSNATRAELEQFTALLQGYLSAEHNEDGEHTDISAESIEVSGDAEVTGDLTVTGDADIDGVHIGAAGNSTNGMIGVRLRTAATDTNLIREFHVVSDIASVVGARLMFYDASGDRDMGGWRWNNGRTAYEFSPDPTTKADRTVSLGSPTDSSQDGWWDDAYISSLYLGSQTSPAAGQWTTYSPSWTNLTVGNGTVAARYTRIDKTVHFVVTLTWGNTTSIAGAVGVSLPSAHTAANVPFSRTIVLDASTNLRYAGDNFYSSTPDILLYTGASPLAAVDATVPITFTTSDVIYVVGTYEVA
jgi:hypothetical protein